MTLMQYLNRKFDNRKGSMESIVYMLKASFFAPSFRIFWQQWNPLWSYYLTYYLYKPINKIAPQAFAILLTFTFSGLLHDGVAMLFSQKFSFFLTPVFALFGVLIIIEKLTAFDLYQTPKIVRPIYHVTLISICTVLIYYIQFVK